MKKRYDFWINPKELAQISKIAKRRNEKTAEMIRQAIRDFIRNDEERKVAKESN